MFFFHDSLLLRNSNFRKNDITSLQKNVKYNILKLRLDNNENKVLKKNRNKVITHYCLHFTAIAKKYYFKPLKRSLFIYRCIDPPSHFQ